MQMKIPPITSSLRLTLSLACAILLLGLFPSITTPLLQFDRNQIASGEWWRLLSGQFVHYGLYHLMMNVAALILCGYIFLSSCNFITYSVLLLVTGVFVGAGIYWCNPELSFYTGLSGILHGLIIFGLISTFRQTPWINSAAAVLVAMKLWQEQSENYQATELQQLLPVPVAVDAHLYGAIGGLVFAAITAGLYLIQTKLINNWKSRN